MNVKIGVIGFGLILAIFCPADAVVVVAKDDAYINYGDADANYGGQNNIGIFDHATAGRKSYIRFDVSDVAGITGSSMITLTVQSSKPSSDYTINVYGLNDGHAGESWDEKKITWNNAPGNDTTDSYGGILSDEVTFLGQLLVKGGAAQYATVTFSSPELDAFLAADTDGQVTLILADSSTSSYSTFYSSELKGSQPTLTVTP